MITKSYTSIYLSFILLILSIILVGYLSYEINEDVKQSYNSYVEKSNNKKIKIDNIKNYNNDIVYKNKDGIYISESGYNSIINIENKNYVFKNSLCYRVLSENIHFKRPSYFYETTNGGILLTSYYINTLQSDNNDLKSFCILKRAY